MPIRAGKWDAHPNPLILVGDWTTHLKNMRKSNWINSGKFQKCLKPGPGILWHAKKQKTVMTTRMSAFFVRFTLDFSSSLSSFLSLSLSLSLSSSFFPDSWQFAAKRRVENPSHKTLRNNLKKSQSLDTLGEQTSTKKNSKLTYPWWFKMTFLGWLSGPFKGCWWPPTFGDEKVTAWITWATSSFLYTQTEPITYPTYNCHLPIWLECAGGSGQPTLKSSWHNKNDDDNMITIRPGGWTNPLCKFLVKMGSSSPNGDENKKDLKPPPSNNSSSDINNDHPGSFKQRDLTWSPS